jgi:hypothetical protein
MEYRTWLNRLFAGVAASALIVSAVGQPAVAAAAEEEAGPNTGALSLSLNQAFTTAYMFRGIKQEGNGFIWQPSVGLSLNVYKCDEGALRDVSVAFGIWNSVQSKKTGWTHDPKALYETDYYPSLTFGWADGVSTTLAYYFYTSPNGAFSTVGEADATLAWDDSEYLDAWAMHPHATFAFEADNSSYGAGRGNYFEFGIAPGFEAKLPGAECDCYPITFTFPMTLGLSMGSYYNDGTNNDTFGFAAFGANASVPLAFIPKNYGAWSVSTQVDLYSLGDTIADSNNHGHNFEAVSTTNISMSY